MNLILILIGKPAIILLLACVLLLLLRRASSSVRHALWFTAIVSAAVLPLADAVLPKWDLPVLTESITVVFQQDSMGSTALIAGSSAATSYPAVKTATPWALIDYVGLIWMVGLVVVGSRFLLGIRAARRLIREARRPGDARWVAMLDQMRSNLQVSKSVELVISRTPCSPMTSGVFQSIIILPPDSDEWSMERRRLVLAHELSHVKRHDRLLQIVVQTMCGIYWFNPLFWYAAQCLSVERERLCDDEVLNLGHDACTYAAELLEMARAASSNRILSAAAIPMAQPSQLEARLRAITDARQSRRKFTRPRVALLWMTTACCVVLLTVVRVTATPVPVLLLIPPPLQNFEISEPVGKVTMPPSSSPTESKGLQQWPDAKAEYLISDEEKAAFHNLATDEEREHFIEQFWARQDDLAAAFRKWLAEDVAYLISDEEKAAFQRLKTNEERDFFIEQFWLRRDPTAGTPENEMKEEHYRRIDYANSRFGWANQAGWEADRGRIFIIHGKPDEIESHPLSAGTYAYELWTYRYIQEAGGSVQFEFIDPAQNGEYRLKQQRSAAPRVNWAGRWKANPDKSILGLYPLGGDEVKPSNGFTWVLDPQQQTVMMRCEFFTVSGRPQWVLHLRLPYNGSISIGPSAAPQHQGIKSIGLKIIDENSFEFILTNYADRTVTNIAKVSNDGSTLTVTNSLRPNMPVVFDKVR